MGELFELALGEEEATRTQPEANGTIGFQKGVSHHCPSIPIRRVEWFLGQTAPALSAQAFTASASST